MNRQRSQWRLLVMFWRWVTAVPLCIGIASACLWDHDTFAVEAAGKNDLVAVLAGRFERNPPLYYEMRLSHSLANLKTDPGLLEEYDNAAVAAERLGQHNQAIQIIGRKRTHMLPLPADKEGWYRYYANLGTFHAHRAISLAAENLRQQDLKLADSEITKAIEINPDAHFGRERYQLYAIRWLEGPRTEALGDYVNSLEPRESSSSKSSAEKAIKGWSGLIRLGNAWESVDVWLALAQALDMRHDASLCQFARVRLSELEQDGKKSMAPGTEIEFFGGEPDDDIAENNKVIFKKLRRSADEWQRRRTEFMLARLKEGRHPDWDAKFWDGWDDEPKLDVPSLGFLDRYHSLDPFARFLLVLAGIIFIPILLFVEGLLLSRKKRRTSR